MNPARHAFLVGVLIIVFLLLDTRGAHAGEGPGVLPTPLRPNDVVLYARRHRAEIVAAKARAAAASAAPRIVSVLPDPMVMASVDHLPFSRSGVDWSILVQQDFPLGGSLGARGRVAEAEARAASADVLSVQLDVEYSALAAYLAWFQLQRMGAVVADQLIVAQRVFAAAKVRLSVSEGAAADVVRAQVEIAKLEGERRAVDAEASAAATMLNASLGRPIDAELPAADLAVPPGDPPGAAELAQLALDRRPELVAMLARVDRSAAAIDVMQSMYRPMAFVRGGYSQNMADGPGVMFMFGVSVPIWRDKLEAGVSEARSMKFMAEAEVVAARKMIEGQVAEARGQVVGARARLSASRERVLPLARQALALMLASYGAGQVALVSVLEATKLVRDARLEEVVAEARLAAAWARLGRAVGVVRIDGLP